jgi:hypothetical protein
MSDPLNSSQQYGVCNYLLKQRGWWGQKTHLRKVEEKNREEVQTNKIMSELVQYYE